jgi:predicted transcriptional regulator of viral defense system
MAGFEVRLLHRLSHVPPTFTARAASAAALSPRDLARLREAGEIDELSRGVYRRADAEPTAHLDLLAVCTRAPHAVVCGESALSLHELIDDIPHQVHIAVPRGSHRPSISYPPTKVSQYAAGTFDFAVERFEAAHGETVPVYSAARAVVDAMRLGRAEGRSLALSALNRYLRRTGQQGVADLQRAARELGAMPAIRPAIEAVLA